VNAALGRIGYKMRVGSLLEGSDASKLALDIYSQTRDRQLCLKFWDFAERDTVLTLQKTAPPGGYMPPNTWTTAFPILPWVYQYALPADYLQFRSLRPSPIFIPEFDPRPVEYRIANDTTVPGKVLLCNLAGAILVYTAQITNPSEWKPLFTETLIAALARELSAALAGLDVEKVETQDEGAADQIAIARIN
jgi:hypothetical protein